MAARANLLSLASAAAVACSALVGCRSAPPLMTPEQARDQVYDHRSRAAAAWMLGNRGVARKHRAAASRYQNLIQTGQTTRPEEALERGVWHRERAEALQNAGYTRFVPAELAAAAKYEDFAATVGAITRDTAARRAIEYHRLAKKYRRLGLRPFFQHYAQQAEKLQGLASSPEQAPRSGHVD